MSTSSTRQQTRAVKRALDRATRSGCACCKKPLSTFLPAGVVLVATRYEVWHLDCLKPGMKALSVVSAEMGVDPAVTADRIWFEQHPDRNHYLRPALPEEWERRDLENFQLCLARNEGFTPATTDIPVERRYVAVKQFEPGKRLRIPYQYDANLPLLTEEELAAEFLRYEQGKRFEVVTPGMAAPYAGLTAFLKAAGQLEYDNFDIAQATGESIDQTKH
jgi:hypothetical protein